jgi:hypothetical protein
VKTVAINNGILYVGGQFTEINGEARTNVAAFELSSGQLRNWKPMVFGQEVNQLLVVSNAVFIGGNFVAVNGLPRRNLAAVTQESGAVFNWAPNPDGEIEALAYMPNSLLVGGRFLEMAGKPISNLAIFPEAGWAKLYFTGISNGQFNFAIIGEEEVRYQVESSSDLLRWEVVFTGTLPNGKLPYSGPMGESLFYRVSAVAPEN